MAGRSPGDPREIHRDVAEVPPRANPEPSRRHFGTISADLGDISAISRRLPNRCGLGLLATIQDQLGGDLDRVEQVVKLFGIVASAPEFKQQHLVLNGCSDVMMAVLGGERGYHARSAIGTNTLPLDSPVEVEAIITVKPA